MPLRYIEKILRASVYDVAIETPLDFAKTLSQRTQNQVFLKREDLQSVFSFKLRGAYNKIASLSEEEKRRGVIAASAGNHAQGVALSAQKLGINALIVMPTTTPEIKSQSVKSMGAEIVLVGDSYSESCDHAYELVKQSGRVFIHPYDDEEVIAGQGTVAMEILRQSTKYTKKIDAIFVPVGGGGLIAGVAVYAKFVRPDIKIIGVEPEDSDCLKQALKAGKPIDLPIVGLFTDGVAVKKIGEKTFELAQKYVDEVITVSTDEICAAIKDIFDDTRSIAEPAGALATAGLKKYIERENVTGQTLVAIDSGANMNFDRLRYVAERAQVGEHREILLAVTIQEKPGSFLDFCELLGDRNITEFNYRYFNSEEAQVFVGISSNGTSQDRTHLISRLEEKNSNFKVVDMTENDLAKEHIRYMVGGHLPHGLPNEFIYSFEFPERPSALLRFLRQLETAANISLFHYRNHGAAFGKVLIGVQIPSKEKLMFEEFLKLSEYSFHEETNNPAYQLFSGGKTN